MDFNYPIDVEFFARYKQNDSSELFSNIIEFSGLSLLKCSDINDYLTFKLKEWSSQFDNIELTYYKILRDEKITIYTDGAYSSKRDRGGWCGIILEGDDKTVVSGREEGTTNNRMELTAAIRSLFELKKPYGITLYSDSKYLVNAVENGWIKKWMKNGWKTAEYEDVKNIDLWQTLHKLNSVHSISYKWVKGHNDNEYNEMADEVAHKLTT